MNKLNVGLVYDLRSDYEGSGLSEEELAEFDSESTIAALAAAIVSLGNRVERIGNGKALAKRLVAGGRWDLVFNIAEGRGGRSREAQVPALLEMYEIPYTLSDPLTCCVTLDKEVAKSIVRGAGLRTPDSAVVDAVGEADGVDLPFPVFCKPLAEGTGKGIDGTSRADSPEQLWAAIGRLLVRHRQPVLVEEYLPGREFTTGILGTGEAARVLGTLEVKIKENAPARDYSFENKERCEQFVEYVLVTGGPEVEAVEALALRAYLALGCRDCARVDVRMDAEGRPAFLEVNPLPGLHPDHSDLPMIATAKGMEYRELIGAILQSALARAESFQDV